MKRNIYMSALGIATISVLLLAVSAACHGQAKPRIVITADPELDDANSLIRFLLYSSDYSVEGLIYTSSQFHWAGDGKGTKLSVPGREYTRFGLNLCPCESYRWAKGERFIDDIVEIYEKVYANLKVHNPDFPTPETLKSKIRFGNIEFDGDYSKDTPGSDLIKKLMLDDNLQPLYITAWGGQSTIARALKSIQDQYEKSSEWEALRSKVLRKVIILPSGDQDDTYAKYIKPNWPEIDYRQMGGGPDYSYGAQLRATPENATYLTSTWMSKNVTGRGPLGSYYRVWGDGKQMVKGDIFDYFGIAGRTSEELKKMGYIVWLPVQEKGSWLGEGDNLTFMNMLDNGLRGYEHGTYGGWGGKQVKPGVGMTFPAEDKAGPPFPNFFPAAQHDFAARLEWSVTPAFNDANHEPKVSIDGPMTTVASAGERVTLKGIVSDPDGNSISIKWWQFKVGTYPGDVVFDNPSALATEVSIPADAAPGQTIHCILEATDNGSTPLTRYQRVIITVK
ncbi:MAG TPA: nucleoside hydrolase-like domain-containing protein [Chryseosolibacter sp.]